MGTTPDRRRKAAPFRPTSIADALFTTGQQRVLGVLFGNPERSFYTGEIIALAGGGTGAVQRILARLESAALVTTKHIGNQKHYQANHAAAVFTQLHKIVVRTFDVPDILRAAPAPLAPKIDPTFAFGPSTRRPDSATSHRGFKDVLSAFVTERVEFLVVGAYALAAHGAPRATGDLEVWIRRDTRNADRVLRALVIFGAPVTEVSRRELVTPDCIVEIGVAPTRIDILTSVDAVDFDDAWPNRLVAKVGGVDVPLIGRRDLIRNKRAVGGPRGLAEIEALEAVRKRRRKRKKGG